MFEFEKQINITRAFSIPSGNGICWSGFISVAFMALKKRNGLIVQEEGLENTPNGGLPRLSLYEQLLTLFRSMSKI